MNLIVLEHFCQEGWFLLLKAYWPVYDIKVWWDLQNNLATDRIRISQPRR
jgi:hypothetical protein